MPPSDQSPRSLDSRLRVVFFGMRGAFSVPPLRALLKAGAAVCGVVVPAPARHGPPMRELRPQPAPSSSLTIMLQAESTIVELAWERQIPVWECADLRSPTTLHMLGTLEADLGCVVCFAWRIPEALLALPRRGLLNVHPSLLPAYRGPAPLFWALHDGAPTGVTLHWMDAGLDTGPIARQRTVILPDGCSGTEADVACATAGGQLLIEALEALQHGDLPRIPQPTTGTAAPWPSAPDFAISTAWSARRAFNFMRATAEWAMPYPLLIDGSSVELGRALRYTPGERLDTSYVVVGQTIRVQCADGVLDATLEG